MHKVETQFGGRRLAFETGRIAPQAHGAVMVSYGDAVVLGTVVMSKPFREGLDFFPLSVDYEERSYSIGKIPGSVFRREGRPPLAGILASRLTDRPLRPLFPEGMRSEVQIILTVLAHDRAVETDVIGTIAASAALMISGIPFEGPVASVRVGIKDGEFELNPTIQENVTGDLDLVVAGTRDGVVMLEAGASEIDEDTMIPAIAWGQEQLQSAIDLQLKLRDLVQPEPREPVMEVPDPAVASAVEDKFGDVIAEAMRITDRSERGERMRSIQEEAVEAFADQFEDGDVGDAFHDLEGAYARRAIVLENKRPDGRAEDEIRSMSADVGILPRVHGTGLFQRGETQVLSVVTLGTVRDEQRIGLSDLEELVEPKRYMHHYNMPPFASGEARRLGGPRRRETGHGALAERALLPVVPSVEDFPYAIRVVSEVLSSNGSTSQGSVCGSTLALLDAGVPLKAPVAGISIGLVTADDGSTKILTDIQGAEDHFGDMDFKVAGTEQGITAIQLDIKVKFLTAEIVETAIRRGRDARMKILEVMNAAISEPNADVGEFAPKIVKTQIDPEKIGAIIGPGGRTIRRLEADTGASIDIEEDGTIMVGATSRDGSDQALQMIKDMTGEVDAGRTMLGKVTRIFGFGVMVEFLPGREGLVPRHELAEESPNMIEDVVNIGDDIMVMVIETDDQGRVNLSRRAVLQGLSVEETRASAAPAPRGEGRGGRGGRRDDRGGRGGRRDDRGGRGGGRNGGRGRYRD
jgi:polyribonucleotide nucleotidyltransferase